jgi:hypothetical protein
MSHVFLSLQLLVELKYPQYAEGGVDTPDQQHLPPYIRNSKLEYTLYVYEREDETAVDTSDPDTAADTAADIAAAPTAAASDSAVIDVTGAGTEATAAQGGSSTAVIASATQSDKADQIKPATAKPAGAAVLHIHRKLKGPGVHNLTLPRHALQNDPILHGWLVCSSVVGMDVSNVVFRLSDAPEGGAAFSPSKEVSRAATTAAQAAEGGATAGVKKAAAKGRKSSKSSSSSGNSGQLVMTPLPPGGRSNAARTTQLDIMSAFRRGAAAAASPDTPQQADADNDAQGSDSDAPDHELEALLATSSPLPQRKQQQQERRSFSVPLRAAAILPPQQLQQLDRSVSATESAGGPSSLELAAMGIVAAEAPATGPATAQSRTTATPGGAAKPAAKPSRKAAPRKAISDSAVQASPKRPRTQAPSQEPEPSSSWAKRDAAGGTAVGATATATTAGDITGSASKRKRSASSGPIKSSPACARADSMLALIRHKGVEMGLNDRVHVDRLDGLGVQTDDARLGVEQQQPQQQRQYGFREQAAGVSFGEQQQSQQEQQPLDFGSFAYRGSPALDGTAAATAIDSTGDWQQQPQQQPQQWGDQFMQSSAVLQPNTAAYADDNASWDNKEQQWRQEAHSMQPMQQQLYSMAAQQQIWPGSQQQQSEQQSQHHVQSLGTQHQQQQQQLHDAWSERYQKQRQQKQQQQRQSQSQSPFMPMQQQQQQQPLLTEQQHHNNANLAAVSGGQQRAAQSSAQYFIKPPPYQQQPAQGFTAALAESQQAVVGMQQPVALSQPQQYTQPQQRPQAVQQQPYSYQQQQQQQQPVVQPQWQGAATATAAAPAAAPQRVSAWNSSNATDVTAATKVAPPAAPRLNRDVMSLSAASRVPSGARTANAQRHGGKQPPPPTLPQSTSGTAAPAYNPYKPSQPPPTQPRPSAQQVVAAAVTAAKQPAADATPQRQRGRSSIVAPTAHPLLAAVESAAAAAAAGVSSGSSSSGAGSWSAALVRPGTATVASPFKVPSPDEPGRFGVSVRRNASPVLASTNRNSFNSDYGASKDVMNSSKQSNVSSQFGSVAQQLAARIAQRSAQQQSAPLNQLRSTSSGVRTGPAAMRQQQQQQQQYSPQGVVPNGAIAHNMMSLTHAAPWPPIAPSAAGRLAFDD